MKQHQNYSMKKIAVLFIFILFIVPFNFGQKSFFYGQKNLISIGTLVSPRLFHIQNNNQNYRSSGHGTYYQHYDEKGKLESGNQVVNLMLNASYLRMITRNMAIGLEFSYQKHNLTNHKTLAEEFIYYQDLNDVVIEEFTASSPRFNMYEVKFIAGSFLGPNIAPGNHLLQYGIGFRSYSLDQKMQYYFDKDTPVTHSQFMGGYENNFIFIRLSIGYTYRVLLTKNLSLDLGATFNLGGGNIFGDSYSGNNAFPQGYFYFKDTPERIIYDRPYVKNRLGRETFSNVIYFRFGLSFAI